MRLIKLVLKTPALFFLLEVHNFKYFLLTMATHGFVRPHRPPICNRSSYFKIDRKSQSFYVTPMNGEKRNSLKTMSDKWSVRQFNDTPPRTTISFTSGGCFDTSAMQGLSQFVMIQHETNASFYRKQQVEFTLTPVFDIVNYHRWYNIFESASFRVFSFYVVSSIYEPFPAINH